MPDAHPMTIDRAAPAHVTRAATFQPASYREADNSIEVVWSIGAAGMRYDWTEGYFMEELSMDPGAVRLGRLNAGAPLLDSHQTGSLKAVIGSVAPGTARVAAGQGTARVRLAKTPDVADTVAKIIDGHIRNVSVAYSVFQFLRTEKAGEHPHLLATDWEPTEISMVTVPFDAAAQVRSRSSSTMPDVIENPETRSDDPPAPRGTVSVTRIRELCSRTDDLSRAFERDMLIDHADQPLTLRQVQQRIADELIAVREREPIDPRGGNRGGGGQASGSPGMLAERMTGALYARFSGKAPADDAREFMGASLIDMARGMMEARGERVRWASPGAVVDHMSRGGAHTTSDFPTIFGNAAQRFLADVITATPSPLRAITRQRLANDFRRMAILHLSGSPALLIVKENGEFKAGTAVESQEGYGLGTYGRLFNISRQALINDDLGAFQRVFEGWGRAATDLEANMLKAVIEGNGLTLGDTKALYHADHNNLAATGSAITVPALSAGRQAMRTQKDFDGSPMNIVPKYLVVGAEKETEAEQALATLAAATRETTNPFSGKLELIVDGRLTGPSWRLFADPLQSTVIEEARLAGQEDVFVDSKVGFEVDGVSVKARLDIAAAAVDYRGTYKNPGA